MPFARPLHHDPDKPHTVCQNCSTESMLSETGGLSPNCPENSLGCPEKEASRLEVSLAAQANLPLVFIVELVADRTVLDEPDLLQLLHLQTRVPTSMDARIHLAFTVKDAHTDPCAATYAC